MNPANLRPSTGSRVVLLTAALAWAAGLGRMLTHALVVSNDSVSNYAHVWYISERLWDGHGIPYHFPALSHGEGLAIPYGAIPWLIGGLLRPAFGDWAVTLLQVAGVVGLIAATFFALQEVRRPGLAVLVLLNPFLIEAALLFQMPFVWGAALLFAAIGLFRRGYFPAAAIIGGLAQANHAPVILPIAGLLAVGWFFARPADRGRLVPVYLVSVLIALPAAWVAISGPTVQGSSLIDLAGQFLGTVLLRLLVFAIPIGIAVWRPRRERIGALAVASFLIANAVVVPLRSDQYAWGSLWRQPDKTVERFTATADFEPGITYRILRVGDGKVGMDQLLRAGARLDSEFFPESIERRSFANAAEYAGFLEKRHVDAVMLFDNYTPRYRTNEAELLEKLTAAGCARLPVAREGYRVYSISLRDACRTG